VESTLSDAALTFNFLAYIRFTLSFPIRGTRSDREAIEAAGYLEQRNNDKIDTVTLKLLKDAIFNQSRWRSPSAMTVPGLAL
jgi:hypothetical protein